DWAAARAFSIELLAGDVAQPHFQEASAVTRRSALCAYLTWLAGDDPALLNVADALSDSEVNRYLASDAAQRRRSHRSRVAARSVLRSFRALHPNLFFELPQLSGRDPVLAPVEDWQFDVALSLCDAFRHPATRARARAVLLLA